MKKTKACAALKKRVLRESTRKKLSPQLQLFLSSLVTYRVQREKSGDEAAHAGLAANLLNSISALRETEHFPFPPVVAAHSKTEAIARLESRIAELLPNAPNKQRAESLGLLPALLENPTIEELSKFADKTYGDASEKEKLFVEPVKPSRSNRDPLPAFQKHSHRVMMTGLCLLGAVRNASSEFSMGALRPDELKEIFDLYCPACKKAHEAEALKKSAARFIADLARRAAKGKRLGRQVEIQHID